jgi:threonine/homoserine/homoserine lactone efflux protein
LYALIAGFSVSYIISFLRTNQTIIQIVGAIALFCLGLYIFTSHPLKAIKKYRKSNKNPVQCLFSSMLITLSNPIPILAYIIVFTGAKIFFDIDHPTSPILFIISFIIGASSWWFLLTFTINKFRHHFNLLRLWWFNKISGGLIMSIVIISTILMLIYGNPGF